MKRRTYADVAAEARDQERDACVELLQEKAAAVGALARRGRIGGEEANMLSRRLLAVAGELKAGLHR